MKKYTIPTAKFVELDAECSLLANSIETKPEEFQDESQILTNQQSGNSIWDNWSE